MYSQAPPHSGQVHELARRFQTFPSVEAIAIGGSLANGSADASSDIDLYVYSPTLIPLRARQALVEELGASRADLNLRFWDTGDTWIDAKTGVEIDVMYWEPDGIAEQIDRLLVRHLPSIGYSTCFWFTVHQSQLLFDRHGWFAQLQQRCSQAYPETLRQSIIAKNHAVLRNVIPSYAHQIQKASRRGDQLSVNHRVAALLASYFHVIFALNSQLHPGEKRLIAYAEAHCPRRPKPMAEQVEALLRAVTAPTDQLLPCVQALLDSLDACLRQEGLGEV